MVGCNFSRCKTPLATRRSVFRGEAAESSQSSFHVSLITRDWIIAADEIGNRLRSNRAILLCEPAAG
jgi:hypothetical protein